HLLFVRVALLVAVEELRDGGVAPVDDAHAAPDAGRLAEADVAPPALLAQPQVREVRGARVDPRRAPRGLELAQQRAPPIPLLEERQPVLLLLARNQDRPDPLELLDQRGLGALVPGGLVGEG